MLFSCVLIMRSVNYLCKKRFTRSKCCKYVSEDFVLRLICKSKSNSQMCTEENFHLWVFCTNHWSYLQVHIEKVVLAEKLVDCRTEIWAFVPVRDATGRFGPEIFSWIFGEFLQKSRVEILCFACQTSSLHVCDKVY